MLKPEAIVKSIYRLRSRIDNFLSENIEKAGAKGLMVSHGNILVQLYKEDRQPMAKIAAEIGKCKSTVTTLVDKLEKVEFVKREVNPEDVRVKNLALTPKGMAFQEDFWKISDKLNVILWQDFTEKEKEKFLLCIEKMDKNIQKALESLDDFEVR